MDKLYVIPGTTLALNSITFMWLAIVAGVFWLLEVIAYWRLFKKAGAHGWQSIIPIYNEYKFFKITWSGGMFFLMLLFSVINGTIAYFLQNNLVTSVGAVILLVAEIILAIIFFIFHCIACVKTAHAYGKGGGFAVGLFFLRPIFILILGLGSSRYVGKNR